jgi:hypothetical protein
VAVSFGPEWEAAVAELCGWNPDSVNPGSVSISLLNPGGKSTVIAQIRVDIDTDALEQTIRDALDG